MEYRIEKDTMGEIQVPKDAYYGAQAARSIMNFQIGIEKFPRELIEAFGILKKACALTNFDLGIMPDNKKNLIAQAAR